MRNRNQLKCNQSLGIAIQIAIIIIISEHALSGKCPQPETVYPCTCSQDNDRISCIKFNPNDFNSSYTLPQIFESLSNSLENNEKAFTELLIANTQILELGEDVFSGITFEKIDIYENNLTRVHSNAFGNSYQTVKQIYMNCLTLRNTGQNYSLFEALSSLINLETITLDLGLDSLTVVPDNAFQPLNGIQSKLQEINLNGVISSVGQYAFNALPNLKILKIFAQIDYISTHAFELNSSSTDELDINLSNNQLIGSSFEINSFSNLKRPINLNLAKNKIRYLDQTVFESFFEANSGNNIALLGNKLTCTDCQSYWLIEQKSQINGRISDAICHDGKSIWDYNWSCESHSTSTSPSPSTSPITSPGPENSCYNTKLSISIVLSIIIIIKIALN